MSLRDHTGPRLTSLMMDHRQKSPGIFWARTLYDNMVELSFKEWVRGQASQQLLQILAKVVRGLRSLLDLGEPVVEGNLPSYTKQRHKLEPEIFAAVCEEACRFIRRYVPEFTGEVPQEKTCGTEGCCYFLNENYCVKLTLGREEAEVARYMSGDEVVPVLDVMQEPKTGVYLIMMHRISTDFARDLFKKIETAATRLSRFIHALVANNLVEQYFKYVTYVEWYQGVSGGAAPSDVDRRLFEIIEKIYKKSGYFLHSDLGVGNDEGVGLNLGLKKGQGPAAKRIQLLDLGHPYSAN